MVVRIDTVQCLGVIPKERLVGTHWIGPVGSSASLGYMAKRKTTGSSRKKETPGSHFMEFV